MNEVERYLKRKGVSLRAIMAYRASGAVTPPDLRCETPEPDPRDEDFSGCPSSEVDPAAGEQEAGYFNVEQRTTTAKLPEVNKSRPEWGVISEYLHSEDHRLWEEACLSRMRMLQLLPRPRQLILIFRQEGSYCYYYVLVSLPPIKSQE